MKIFQWFLTGLLMIGMLHASRTALYDFNGRYIGETVLSRDISRPTALLIVDESEGTLQQGIAVPYTPTSVSHNFRGQWIPNGFVDVSAQYLPQSLWYSGDIETGDLNGDGLTDIAFTIYLGDSGEDHRPRVWFQNPDFTFTDMTEQSIPPVYADCYDIDLADLDGDGDLDMVVSNSEQPNTPVLLINNGNGVFSIKTGLPALPINSFIHSVEPIDVNVDGYPDLVFCIVLTGPPYFKIVLWMNDGTGNFYEDSLRLPPPAQYGFWQPRESDIDHDGQPDIVFSAIPYTVTDPNGNPIAFYSGGLVVYHNLGGGYFADETESRVPPHPEQGTRTFAIADLDNDGDSDIVDVLLQLNAGPGEQIHILVNDGSGHFSLHDSGLPDSLYGWFNDIEAKDFDGDSLVDLFLVKVQIATPDYDLFLENQGNLNFSDASNLLPPIQDFSTALATLDFNYDGAMDVVIANNSPEDGVPPYPNKLYENELTGVFESNLLLPPVRISLPSIASPPVVAKLQIGSPMDIEVRIFNSAGRLISSRSFRFSSTGIHTVTVTPNNLDLPSGPYFLTFQSPTMQITKKVLIPGK